MKQQTTTAIKSFIASLCDKNYKEANTSLQKMIETKLRERIIHSEKGKNN